MTRRSDRQFITDQAQATWGAIADGDSSAWLKGRRTAAAEGPGTPAQNLEAFEKAMDKDWKQRSSELQDREAQR